MATKGLTFKQTKNENVHIATEEDTVYKLVNGTSGWKVTADGETIATSLKGYARAVDAANKHFAENDGEEEQEPVKATSAKGKTTASKPVPAKSTPAPKTAKKKLFPNYDTWLEGQEPRVKVGKGKETPEEYANRTNKLAYGRAKGVYNKQNNLTKEDYPQTAGTGSNSAPRRTSTPREPKPPVDKEELYGERWNDFREQLGLEPDPIRMAVSQLVNARASRDYSIEFGLDHCHMGIAQNSYYKSVERCYTSERRLTDLCDQKEVNLPKGVDFEYLDMALTDISEVEQLALSKYVEYYQDHPEQANKEAKTTVKGKITLDAEQLVLYPLVSKSKRTAAKKTAVTGRRK